MGVRIDQTRNGSNPTGINNLIGPGTNPISNLLNETILNIEGVALLDGVAGAQESTDVLDEN